MPLKEASSTRLKSVKALLQRQKIQVSNLTDINKVSMGCDAGKFNRTANLPVLGKIT